MLKSWSIENFKPIVNSGELKLAPVTVFAGLNSSGKSSLLQSILMISQTLSNQVPERPLIVNGTIVQLGTFEDILSEASRSDTLTVGFELEMDGVEIINMDLDPEWVKVKVNFRGFSNNEINSSALEASKVVVKNILVEATVFHEEWFYITFSLKAEKISDEDLKEFLKNVASDYLRLLPTGEQSSYLVTFDHPQGEDFSGPFLVTLSHFLPTHFIRKFTQKFKEREHRRQRLESAVLYLFEYSDMENSTSKPLFPELFDLDAPLSEDVKASVYEFCISENIPENFSGQSLRDLARWFQSLKEGKRRIITRKLQKIVMQSLLEPESGSNGDPEGLEAFIGSTYIVDPYIRRILRFFTRQIRYLGPLRADPQASQKFAPSSELDDVGAKGEYAAAVYDANQQARIDWYNPFSEQVEQGTLKVALDSWAHYLGVAHQIKIETAGQRGFSWQVVHHEGQKPLPLSAVGVGVSQVLPILVMGLLSPSGTLLIIEQPELHLHPRVQSRLGDFFVGLSKCKKQCLIETHSENLVNQLRYHIVQSGGQDKSDCMIYFVDQDERGAARFEPVEISPKGNILNWPEGFFDETMQQEDRITAESMKRRANVAENG